MKIYATLFVNPPFSKLFQIFIPVCVIISPYLTRKINELRREEVEKSANNVLSLPQKCFGRY